MEMNKRYSSRSGMFSYYFCSANVRLERLSFDFSHSSTSVRATVFTTKSGENSSIYSAHYRSHWTNQFFDLSISAKKDYDFYSITSLRASLTSAMPSLYQEVRCPQLSKLAASIHSLKRALFSSIHWARNSLVIQSAFLSEVYVKPSGTCCPRSTLEFFGVFDNEEEFCRIHQIHVSCVHPQHQSFARAIFLVPYACINEFSIWQDCFCNVYNAYRWKFLT